MSQVGSRSSVLRARYWKLASLFSLYRNSTAVFPWFCAIAFLAAPPAFGGPLPTGGQYVAGQGTITGATNGLTINQATSRGIINWQGFSIGTGNTVQFNNGAGATLNRVIGTDISKISGQLNATGSVYLINPQGVVIGPGGKVVTNGSFVASTRDVSNSAFMGGGALTASGTSNGDVVNAGTITSQNGDAILVGRSVRNSGTIKAPNGTAAMAAGNQILLQPVGGDPRIAVSGGTGDVTNSGTVSAAQAQLSAAGGNVYALAGNNGGIVSATGTKTINGHVWLTAGGSAEVSGTIAATNADGSGGVVTVRGTDIKVPGQVDASATQAGKTGGNISIIATGSTKVTGTIKAKGGVSGSGGTIETSGNTLSISGATVDAGMGGSWLLDPYDLTVDASAASTINSSLGAGTSVSLQTTASGTSGPGVVNTMGLGDITIASPLTWSTAAGLTLDAYHSINVNANIANTGGASVTLYADNTGTGLGSVSFAAGKTVSTAGTVSIFYNPSVNPAGSIVNSTSYVSPAENFALNVTGGGTLASYMLVNSAYDLQNVQNNLTGSYALGRDIDAGATASWNSGAGFAPIGNASTPFTGTLDGQTHTIADLTINRPSDYYVGLFGELGDGAAVSHLGLIGANVTGGQSVGILAGDMNGADISQSYTTGVVSGDSTVGGLVGGADGGQIFQTYSSASVAATWNFAGGLVGSSSSSITQSYATGSVSGEGTVGGLVGYNYYSGKITQSYASGTVSGTSLTGGLVGLYEPYPGESNIQDSYWDTDTTGQSAGIGSGQSDGVTALTSATARTQSSYGANWNFGNDWFMIDGQTRPIGRWEYSTTIATPHQLQLVALDPSANYTLAGNIDLGAALSSDANGNYADMWGAAGFVPLGNMTTPFTGQFDGQGHTIANLTINRPSENYVGLFGVLDAGASANHLGLIGATVIGNDSVGILAGNMNSGTAGINQSYATGAVFGESSVGGLVGEKDGGLISESYASAFVTATDINVGGLVGANTSTITQSYASGAVSGAANVGGLVGVNDGNIDRSYATGAVSVSDSIAGGLVGLNDGLIAQSYASGAVSGSDPSAITGGLVGRSWFYFDIQDSYWDTGTTGQSTDGDDGHGDARPLTTDQARMQSSYDWSFTGDWFLIEGQTRPIGRWEYSTTITNAHQLQLVAMDPTANYTLAGNIDMRAALAADANGNYAGIWGASGFVPLGDMTTPFSGQFDGQGHTIANLTINRPLENYVGLFGILEGPAVVSHLGLTGANVTGGSSVGVLAGYLSGADISQSYTTGAVSGDSTVGGLVGSTGGGQIFQSYSSASVAATEAYAGGLVGNNSGGSVTQSYATGAVSGDSQVGGLVGYNYMAPITQSYATGAVTGNSASGGLVGVNEGTEGNSYIQDSYWDVDSTGQSVGVGIGQSDGATGLTTAQFAGGTLPSGFDNTAWVSHVHYYPCLTWQAGCAPAIIPLTYSVGSASSIYGTLATLNAGTLTGVLASDLADVTPVLSLYDSFNHPLTLSASLNVGTYTAGVGGLTGSAAGFYKIAALGNTDGTLTINPAHVVVTALGGSSTYGSSPANPGLSASGLQNGEDVSVLTGLANSFGIVGTTAAGTHTLTVTGTNGDSNYIVDSTVNGTWTVDARPITVTADNLSRIYGDANPALTYVVGGDGLVNNDTLSGGLATAATSTSNVGGYAITQGSLAASTNYLLSYLPGTLTIDPATLTVSLKGTVEKTYDGSATATLGMSNYSLSGVVASDNVSLSNFAAGAYDNKNAGTGKTVSVTGLGLSGAAAGNYTLASTALNAAIGIIDAAPLAITANNISALALDLAQPTATITGFVNGEGSSLVTGLQYGLFPVTGNSLKYNILPFGASAPNYAISYFAGLLTLNPPPPLGTAAPLITDGGFTTLADFVVTGSFGAFTYSDVATAAIGDRPDVLVFNIGLPGTVNLFDAIALTDYSNATDDSDRLVQVP